MRDHCPESVPLGDVIAALAALFPVTPGQAAENARLLAEETAAYDRAHLKTTDGRDHPMRYHQ